MSAVKGDRSDEHKRSMVPTRDSAQTRDDIDVPGILAGHIAKLYAEAERERRDIGVERAIARARASV